MSKKPAQPRVPASWQQLSIDEEGHGGTASSETPRETPREARHRGGSTPRKAEEAKAEEAMDSKGKRGRGDEMAGGGRGAERQDPTGAADTAGEGPPLEQALARLEAIVRELEAGNIDLDRSLALFEEGVVLSRQAAKRLNEAEAKITKLVRSLDGEFRTEPFSVEDEER